MYAGRKKNKVHLTFVVSLTCPWHGKQTFRLQRSFDLSLCLDISHLISNQVLAASLTDRGLESFAVGDGEFDFAEDEDDGRAKVVTDY